MKLIVSLEDLSNNISAGMSDENGVVKCVVIRETEKAYLLRDSDAPERESWFPKSQVSFRQRNVKTGVAP